MSVLESPRALKVALAVSVALNLFAIAGGVTVWVAKTRTDHRIEAVKATGREASFREIVAAMEPGTGQRVRSTLRASAMAARPDFEAARAARRQAIELMRGPDPDAAAANALLERSRIAESRGRTRLEHDTTALLMTLQPRDRQALVVVLTRRGRGGDGASPRNGGGQKPVPDKN